MAEAGGATVLDTGLGYRGKVTAVSGANRFSIHTLIGKGAGKFDGAANPYSAFVLRDAGGQGAAPQGELQQITAYDPITGEFTTGAFTAPVAIDDEVVILHPSIAATMPSGGVTTSGLCFLGTVTAVPGANQFTVPTLSGLGAGKFAGATNPYSTFVFRDAGGASAAPQGEVQTITAYVTTTGVFTTNAFTAPIAVGDEVLILHPALAQIFLSATGLTTVITTLTAMVFSMDFWSNPQEEVAIPAVAADQALPDIVVANLPAGAIVARAVLMFKFRVVENTNAGANKLNGAQDIQIRDDTPSAWIDAINFLDDMFGLPASTVQGGDVFIGDIDVSGTVDGNDTYNVQWDEALADLAAINFNDVQVGLRIWYRL